MDEDEHGGAKAELDSTIDESPVSIDVGEALANLLEWQESPEYRETDTWLSGLVRAEAANNPDADEFGITQRVLDRLSPDEAERASAFLGAEYITRKLITRGIEETGE